MDAARFRACLDALGWTPAIAARQLDLPTDRRASRWYSGAAEVPEPIAVWLEMLAAVHVEHPPPGRPEREA